MVNGACSPRCILMYHVMISTVLLTGSIDHISIRQLQCVLMKICLLLGVEVRSVVFLCPGDSVIFLYTTTEK